MKNAKFMIKFASTYGMMYFGFFVYTTISTTKVDGVSYRNYFYTPKYVYRRLEVASNSVVRHEYNTKTKEVSSKKLI